MKPDPIFSSVHNNATVDVSIHVDFIFRRLIDSNSNSMLIIRFDQDSLVGGPLPCFLCCCFPVPLMELEGQRINRECGAVLCSGDDCEKIRTLLHLTAPHQPFSLQGFKIVAVLAPGTAVL